MRTNLVDSVYEASCFNDVHIKGVARPLQTKHLMGSNYYYSKLFRYFWYKFFDVNFFILDNVIPQMPLSLIYQTRAPFFRSAKYTQRKINIC